MENFPLHLYILEYGQFYEKAQCLRPLPVDARITASFPNYMCIYLEKMSKYHRMSIYACVYNTYNTDGSYWPTVTLL